MRVWVPLRLDELAEHHASSSVPPGQERVVVAAGEEHAEEAEYDALLEAAALSSARHDGAASQPVRRVVLVAEVPDGTDPDAALSMSQVVAVHADTATGATGDLGWYGVQEVPYLLSGDL